MELFKGNYIAITSDRKEEMAQTLASIMTDKVIIVNIGTDRNIADSFGPFVGYFLKQKGSNLKVFGTIGDTVHALNIHDCIDELNKYYSDYRIIAIDAAISYYSDLGDIVLKDKGIEPGKGVGKKLPKVGEYSIIGIVGHEPSCVNSSVHNLSFPMNMAEAVADVIIRAEEIYNNAYREAEIYESL